MEMQCTIGCADWIITCRVLRCHSRLSLQPDAPFTAAHKQNERESDCTNVRTHLRRIKP